MTAERTVEIPGDDVTLEGGLSLPEGDPPFGGLVICHPHPQYGGSMHNNVVEAIMVAALDSGRASLRFNFRGVGASGGSYDGGHGEQEDVRAALAFLRTQPEVDPARIALAGYSFGAAVAANVALGSSTDQTEAFIAVSLPTMMMATVPGGARPPTLLVSGNSDEYSDIHRLGQITETLGPLTEFQILQDVDHFWWGAEPQLHAAVKGFLDSIHATKPHEH